MIRKTFDNIEYKCNTYCSFRNSQVIQYDTSIQPLYHDVVSVAGESDAIVKNNDVTLLFNQQRISKLSQDTLNHWFDSLKPHSNYLSEIRSKVSDDDLLAVCKSRYIQTPSELLAWDEWLRDNYDEILKHHKKSQEDFKRKFEKLNEEQTDEEQQKD